MPLTTGCAGGALSPLATMSMLGPLVMRKPVGSFTYRTLAFLRSRTKLTTLASSVSGPESSSTSKLTALSGMSLLRPKTLVAPNTR